MLNYGLVSPWFILYVWGLLNFILARRYVTFSLRNRKSLMNHKYPSNNVDGACYSNEGFTKYGI